MRNRIGFSAVTFITMNEAAKQLTPAHSMSRFPSDPAGILLGALMMVWPAFYNRFPLMYPDSPWYINAGRKVAAAVLLNHRSAWYGGRSLIYSLGILPFHTDRTLWPIIAAQSLLTSWILSLVFRAISPRKTWTHFLSVMILLSLLSSASWFGALVMPDILGPDLYLCIFILVFARDEISRIEQIVLLLVSWWAIASHATHLLIAIALCSASTMLAIIKRLTFHSYLSVASPLAIIIVFALGTQISLNAFLCGKPSLEGDHPPFFTARLIEDGPGRWYLQNNCAQSSWEMCRYLGNLSGSSDRFLWSPDGVFANAPLSSQELIRRQDWPLTLAVLHTYPREQLLRSATNSVLQLLSFDLGSSVPSTAVTVQIHDALPKMEKEYLRSRQARSALPVHAVNGIDRVAVTASLVVIGIATWLPRFRSRLPPRLISLGFVIAVCILANALITGSLSNVNSRYGARIIWLVPFLGLLCVFQLAWPEAKPSLPTPAT